MRRLTPLRAVTLVMLTILVLGLLGQWANHAGRTRAVAKTADGVLRVGMTRAQAEAALETVGLNLNYYGIGSEEDRTFGYSMVSLGFGLLPAPGLRYAKLVVILDRDRVVRWRVDTLEEWF